MVRRLPVFLAFLAIVGALPVQAQWVNKNGPDSVGSFAALSKNIASDVTAYSLIGGKKSGLYLSTDFGNAWTPQGSGDLVTNVSVLMRGESTDLVYAGTTLGRIYRSTDGGVGWQAADTGANSTSVRAFAVLGPNLFVGTDSGVFLSNNNGSSWIKANIGLTSRSIRALTVSGANLFAATDSGVYLSVNNGSSWAEKNIGLRSFAVRTLALSGSKLFAGSDSGVYASGDNGSIWVVSNQGLPLTPVRALFQSTRGLLAATSSGVFQLLEGSSTWSAVNSGLTNLSVWSVATSAGVLFVGTDQGVWLRAITQLPSSISNLPLVQQLGFRIESGRKASFTITSPSSARLKAYDVVGNERAILFSGDFPAGSHTRILSTEALPAGLYFFRLQVGDQTETRKVVLTR